MNKVRLIEDYLDGNLAENELKEFQVKYDSDPAFRNDVRLFKEINTSIREDDIVNLRKQLKTITNKNKTKFYLTLPFRYAASIIVVLGMFALYKIFVKPLNTQELYNTFYKTYDADFTKRSANKTKKESTEFGLVLYENGDFEGAYHIFQNYLKENYNNQTIKFFAAIAALETNRTDEAIEALQEISTTKNSLFISKAKWYLSLAYIKNEQIDLAKKILVELSDEPGEYQASAKELLKKKTFKNVPPN